MNCQKKTPYRIIELTQGYVAIIDADDFRRVNRHSWSVTHSAGKNKCKGNPYARTTIKGKKVYLHRFIINPAPGMHVDHINHQTLDCRKCNLDEVDNITNQRRKRRSLNPHKKTKPPAPEPEMITASVS